MNTYTVICVDTGGWETRADPWHESVRVYMLDEFTIASAVRWTREFLIDDFEQEGAKEWRIIAALLGERLPHAYDGNVLQVIDKRKGGK